MKKVVNFLKKRNWAMVMMNACALMAVIQSVNATCFYLHYQPEVPEAAKKFRKF